MKDSLIQQIFAQDPLYPIHQVKSLTSGTSNSNRDGFKTSKHTKNTVIESNFLLQSSTSFRVKLRHEGEGISHGNNVGKHVLR